MIFYLHIDDSYFLFFYVKYVLQTLVSQIYEQI